jgi:hypothetical protein
MGGLYPSIVKGLMAKLEVKAKYNITCVCTLPYTSGDRP